MTLRFFSRKQIRDFDSFAPDESLGHYEPYREAILKDMAYMRSLVPEEVFLTARDGTQLAGALFERGFSRTVLLFHGYCSTPANNFSTIARAFLERGWNVLAVHQRGHGKSGGRFTAFGLVEQYDLLDWVAFMEARFPSRPLALYGISMGGASIAYASDRLTDTAVRAGVIECGYGCPCDYAWDGKKASFALRWPVVSLVRLFAKLLYGVDVRKKTYDALGNAAVPLFFLGGLEDMTVRPALFKKCYEACSSEKALEFVPGAEHALAFAALGCEGRERLFDFLDDQTK